MIRPQPRSNPPDTLFPYPTLFRSRLEFEGTSLLGISQRRLADLRGDRLAMIFQEPMTALNPAYTIGDQLTEALLRHRRVGRAKATERDRKSTRLNSSH